MNTTSLPSIASADTEMRVCNLQALAERIRAVWNERVNFTIFQCDSFVYFPPKFEQETSIILHNGRQVRLYVSHYFAHTRNSLKIVRVCHTAAK